MGARKEFFQAMALGRQATHSKSLPAAMEAFSKAIAIAPDSGRAYAERGYAELMAGSLPTAGHPRIRSNPGTARTATRTTSGSCPASVAAATRSTTTTVTPPAAVGVVADPAGAAAAAAAGAAAAG